jgi:hypothetical protein
MSSQEENIAAVRYHLYPDRDRALEAARAGEEP